MKKWQRTVVVKFFKKSDLIFIGVILIIGIAAMFLFWQKSDDAAVAEIYWDGKLEKTVVLDGKSEYSFRLETLPEVEFTVYTDRTIAFTFSDCPDKVCINTGYIGTPGKIAACVPNRVYIKIVKALDDDAPDIIIGNNGHGYGT